MRRDAGASYRRIESPLDREGSRTTERLGETTQLVPRTVEHCGSVRKQNNWRLS
jgi:hypothetical protein